MKCPSFGLRTGDGSGSIELDIWVRRCSGRRWDWSNRRVLSGHDGARATRNAAPTALELVAHRADQRRRRMRRSIRHVLHRPRRSWKSTQGRSRWSRRDVGVSQDASGRSQRKSDDRRGWSCGGDRGSYWSGSRSNCTRRTRRDIDTAAYFMRDGRWGRLRERGDDRSRLNPSDDRRRRLSTSRKAGR